MPYFTTIANGSVCGKKDAARGIWPKTSLLNTKYQGISFGVNYLHTTGEYRVKLERSLNSMLLKTIVKTG
jgi:hypothetical protein